MTFHIEISPGELWDRITILEIKATRFVGQASRHRLCEQLEELRAAWSSKFADQEGVGDVVESLRAVNLTLWTLETDLRKFEQDGSSPARIAACAIAIRIANDARSELKRQINGRLGCSRQDEKQYPGLSDPPLTAKDRP